MLQTLKLSLSLLFLLFLANISAQNWRQISLEPINGQFSIQHFISTSNGYIGIIGFQQKIQLSNQLEFVPIGSQDILIYSLDREGKFLWASEFNNSNLAQITGVSVNHDEKYIVCTGVFWDTLFISGNRYANPKQGKGIFNAKINLTNGVVQWVNVISGSGNTRQSGGICIQESGKIFANGWFNQSLTLSESVELNTENTGIYLIEMDAGGTFINAVLIGDGFDVRTSLCKCASENIYMAGAFRGNIQILGIEEEGRIQDFEALVLKLDENMNLKWLNTGKGVLDNWIIDLDISPDSIVAIAGHFAGNMNFKDEYNIRSMGSLYDAFIVKFDNNGRAFDSEVYSSSGTYFFNSLKRNKDIYSLSGTFDGNQFLEFDTLQSPPGSRSASVIYWPINQDRDSVMFFEANGQVAFLADLYNSNQSGHHHIFAINFKGSLFTSNQQWDSEGAYQTLILESTIPNNLKESKSLKAVNWLTPNPISEYLFLSDKIQELLLYDLNGKLMPINLNQQWTHIQSIPPGTYIAIMQNIDGERAYQIIVKK
jgi:hypothetical protein